MGAKGGVVHAHDDRAYLAVAFAHAGHVLLQALHLPAVARRFQAPC